MKEHSATAPSQPADDVVCDDVLDDVTGGIAPFMEQDNIYQPPRYQPQPGVVESVSVKYTMLSAGAQPTGSGGRSA